MAVLLIELLRLAAWLMILSAIFVPLERFFGRCDQPIFRKAVIGDLGYYFLNGLVPGLLLSGPLAALALAAHRILPVAYYAELTTWPVWLRAGIAMVVGEVGYYWAHRWSHEIPFLWRFHAVHHRAQQIDFLVNARAHPVDMIFTRMCSTAPLFALGLISPVRVTDGVIPAAVLVAGIGWGYFVHANISWRLGFFEKLISTPAFHHWHHTLAEPVNRNYASMLPWLDRIFGTHYLPKSWPVAYGVADESPEPVGERHATTARA